MPPREHDGNIDVALVDRGLLFLLEPDLNLIRSCLVNTWRPLDEFSVREIHK